MTLTAVFPDTGIQTCTVHRIRHSLTFVSRKNGTLFVPVLRAICRGASPEADMKALEAFEAGAWGSDIRRSR